MNPVDQTSPSNQVPQAPAQTPPDFSPAEPPVALPRKPIGRQKATQFPPTKTEAEKSPPEIKRPKINLERSRELLANIEKVLATRVICYYTASVSLIHQSHPDLFFDHLRQIGEQKTLSLILISDGGQGLASLRIATILREYCQQLQIIVPSRCASAATILALSADKIIMSPAGYLTAIDSSLRHNLNPKGFDRMPVNVSVDQVKRVLKFLNEEGPAKTETGVSEGSYRTLFKYLHPLALGEIDRYSSASELIAKRMMKMHPGSFENEEKINQIASHLVSGYPAHGFPILFQEAREIGLPVEKASKQLSDLLWNLTKVYDSVTRKTITNITPSFYHFEGFPVIIESLAKRTAHRYTYDKRFNPVMKRWQMENDNSRWVNISLSKTDGKGIILSSIDVVVPEEAEPDLPKVEPSTDRPQ